MKGRTDPGADRGGMTSKEVIRMAQSRAPSAGATVVDLPVAALKVKS